MKTLDWFIVHNTQVDEALSLTKKEMVDKIMEVKPNYKSRSALMKLWRPDLIETYAEIIAKEK